MSDPNLADRPEPTEDPPPDDGPGGPADMVHDDENPPATPDQPRSAQVQDEALPDEIDEPEDMDEEEKDTEPGTEAPV